MKILIEKEYFYTTSERVDSTDYCRQQLKQRGRCLHPPQGWLQGHPPGMEVELDAILGYEKNQKGSMETTSKRNGHSPKNLKSQYGEFQIYVPRDRNSEFEPKPVPRYQRDVSGIEEKVIPLYGRGMGTRDMHDQLQDSMGCQGLSRKMCKFYKIFLPAVFKAAGFTWQNQYCSYLRMRACILSSIASWLRTNAQLATGRPFHFLYSSTTRR